MQKIAKNKNILLLLLTALIIRLILAGFGTLTLDQNTFIAWGRIAAEGGLSNFYNSWSDYLPGYIYVLAFLARLENVVFINPTVLYKLPAILVDIATGYLIFNVLKKKGKIALFAAGAFLFNPAVLSNSTLWGQVDVITSFTALLSVYFVKRSLPFSSIALAVGASVKPQAIMAAPFIFAFSVYKKWRLKKFVLYGLTFLATLILLFLPFTSLGDLVSFIAERANTTLGQYQYTSINAFNFWGLFGFWKEDSIGFLSPKNIGIFALIVISIFTFLNRKLAAKKPYHFLAILLLSNFLFFTRMHERHMLPALAPLAIAAATTPVLWLSYAGLSITYVANMYYSYQWITYDFVEVFPEFVVKAFIITNLILFATLVKQTIKPSKAISFKRLFNALNSFREEKFVDRLTKKQEKALLVSILAFSLFVRVIRLDVPTTDYFDEIYHAFTAREILAGSSLPWHWSSAHPEGFAYEWTHPPLAKEIMAVSMGLFGVNSLAWRLPGAISGVAIVYGVYLIAKKLFGSRDLAVLSAFLISLDGLVLTMSRIGTADVYFVAFALFSFYLFLEKRDFSSSIFLGLAAASKWSTLWVLPIFALALLVFRRKLSFSLLLFLIIPPAIYLASYLPMFTFGHNLETFWGMQKQMWWYHSGLEATHPYTSPWWSWPIMGRPVYLYQDYNNGIVSNIYAIGNPIFFWSGLVAMILAIYLNIKNKSASLSVLIFSYFVLFVPWALSPRIMFVYHYLPSLPFMAIVLAYVLKKYKALVAPILLMSTLMFLYFYPHWVAIPVPEWWDKTYYWFSSWR